MNQVKEFYMPKLETIVKMTDSIKTKIEGYLVTTNQKPDISNELLKILNISDDLMELLNPSKHSGEYFGLPKDVVMGSGFPEQIISNSGIDFTPWFSEKTKYIRDGAKRLIKYWEMNPETLKLIEEAPMTKEEYIIDGIESALYQVRIYSDTIIEILERNE